MDWTTVPFCECEQPASYLLKPGDLLVARSGSVGKSFLASDVPDPAVFASYMIRIRTKAGLLPDFVFWCFQSQQFWEQLMSQRRGSAMANINGPMLARLEFPIPSEPLQKRIAEFLKTFRQRLQGNHASLGEMPPPLREIPRLAARIEELATQIHEARTLREQAGSELNAMLTALHRQLASDAPRKPLSEVAPLSRRPVAVDVEKIYPAVAVRSFGRGTFHKPPLVGSEVTWEKPFLVKAGDILISNIKAWEGALAVARPEDDGRVGSHRYLTCVPGRGVATARFVCFYLLTPEGLHEVGEASPGSADRNRTLSAKALMRIPVPVPKYADQLHFDRVSEEVDALKHLQAETAVELAALLPAILDRAFKGEL